MAKRAKKKLFDGVLTDGKKSMRMVSFNPSLRTACEKSYHSKTGGAVVVCSVQKPYKATEGPDYELVMSSYSRVKESPKKFELPADSDRNNPFAPYVLDRLDELEDLGENQSISAVGKVIQVDPPTEIASKNSSSALRKQECIVADS